MQAPPLLERAFSSIMKICRHLIGFIIKVKYFLNAMFIYRYKSEVYFQECYLFRELKIPRESGDWIN